MPGNFLIGRQFPELQIGSLLIITVLFTDTYGIELYC